MFQTIQIGIENSESPEIAYEKDIESCPNSCEEGESCNDVDKCEGPGCFCPFKEGKCVEDPCSLDLCSQEASCRSLDDGYTCNCLEPSTDQYCTLKEQEICPSHWWGRPVCGPCQCNVSQGFNESCAVDTGKCSCKANHFIKGGKCHPCECYGYGSLSAQCDLDSGACSCRPGVSGHKCDKCSHGFAELTSNGCQVIYGVCPAEYADGIWWPRTVFGEQPNATCPENAVGLAKRSCDQRGWGSSDLTGCVHQEFLLLSNQAKANQESWVLAKKAKETVVDVVHQYLTSDLFKKDFEAVETSIFKVVERESNSMGFELAHKKDRQFLDHFFQTVSWLLGNGNATVTLRDVHVMSVIGAYGGVLVRSMENTFTNPFEVITDNVIFGLDKVGAMGSTAVLRQARDLQAFESLPTKRELKITVVPKYNNYIKRANSWSTVKAEMITHDDEARFQYAVYKTNKSIVERELLLVPGLLWGTQITTFSDIFSIFSSAEREDTEVGAEPGDRAPIARSITFTDVLRSPNNRVHCVMWDRDLWNAIDCETQTVDSETNDLKLVVNCTCSTDGRKVIIVAALEESIADGHDYLSSKLDSIIFSVCSSVSLALLLLAGGCLVFLNPRRKTSVRIHRNIVFCFLCTQILILVVVLANTQLTSLSFACTFITMALHYASVATYVWIAVESIHIYRMLSELRDINHGRTTFYSAAGFGIPGLVVGLTMGVSGSSYGSAAFCWLPYSHTSVWGMLGPEICCACIHMVTMMLNLRTVFRVKTDLEDFATLRSVFFINACLLPIVTGFHVSALLLINDRGVSALYSYAGLAVAQSLYLLMGFVICDKTIMKALSQCTGHSKR